MPGRLRSGAACGRGRGGLALTVLPQDLENCVCYVEDVLRKLLGKAEKGKMVELTVERKGEKLTVKVMPIWAERK